MAVARRKGLTFEPRTMVDAPWSFGKVSSKLRPAAGVEATDPRFKAAQLQHLLANSLREHLKTKRRNVEWFASKEAGHPGVSVDRMRRMLRGETMMQFADLTLITSLVEEAREVVIQHSGVDFKTRREMEEENEQMRNIMFACVCGVRTKMPEDWQEEHRWRQPEAARRRARESF